VRCAFSQSGAEGADVVGVGEVARVVPDPLPEPLPEPLPDPVPLLAPFDPVPVPVPLDPAPLDPAPFVPVPVPPPAMVVPPEVAPPACFELEHAEAVVARSAHTAIVLVVLRNVLFNALPSPVARAARP
jgi:hypothetical protein